MITNEIERVKDAFIRELSPVGVYLFGSYANGTYTEDSDLDFYIVVQDSVSDLVGIATRAYKSIRRVKQHSVDIVVGTESRFEERKDIPSVENEVYEKGILLYGVGNKAMA